MENLLSRVWDWAFGNCNYVFRLCKAYSIERGFFWSEGVLYHRTAITFVEA